MKRQQKDQLVTVRGSSIDPKLSPAPMSVISQYSTAKR